MHRFIFFMMLRDIVRAAGEPASILAIYESADIPDANVARVTGGSADEHAAIVAGLRKAYNPGLEAISPAQESSLKHIYDIMQDNSSRIQEHQK